MNRTIAWRHLTTAVPSSAAEPRMRIRIFLTLAALATLIYSVGAPHEHGG